MPTLETGLFILMAGMGFGFMVFSITRNLGTMSFLFRCFSFVMFLGLALFLTTGHDVATTTTTLETSNVQLLNGTITELSTSNTSTEVLIPADSQWVGWIFFGLSIFCAILFIRDMFGVNPK